MLRGLIALSLATLGPIGWYAGYILCVKSCVDGADHL